MESDGREEFVLPEHIEILNETMEAFGPLYGNYTAISHGDAEETERILVYGLGVFSFETKKQLVKHII